MFELIVQYKQEIAVAIAMVLFLALTVWILWLGRDE
jgi:hypothetical protein